MVQVELAEIVYMPFGVHTHSGVLALPTLSSDSDKSLHVQGMGKLKISYLQ